MDFDKDDLWSAVQGELELVVSSANYGAWIKPCFIDSIRNIDESRLLFELACPSGFHQRTVDERYYGQIKKVLEKQTSKICEIALIVKQRPVTGKTNIQSEPDLFESAEEGEVDKNSDLLAAGINPRFSFDNYVVGSSNNLAYAAAKGVIDNPGQNHNPLFLWGGVGLGKTHLMQAIGRKLLEKGYKVQAVTSEQFTNELIATIRTKSVDSFKKKYRSVDALLIDDIQFIAGKESTQEEFFHTFNELYMKGGQVIMTSDRRPQEIEKVEQRLISRFLGGMAVDVGQPDYEMRLAILNQKAADIGVESENGALDLLAQNIATNSRELEGVLVRMVNVAAIEGGLLTKALIQREMGVRVSKASKRMRPQEVLSMVAKEFDYKNKELVGKSRKASLVRARHIAMFLMREEMGMTLQDVAEMFGGRDHTTVMHAVDKIEKEFGVNQETREYVMKMKQRIYK